MSPQHPEHLLATGGNRQAGPVVSDDVRNPSTGEWNAIVVAWSDDFATDPVVVQGPATAAALRAVAARDLVDHVTGDADDTRPVPHAGAADGGGLLADAPREDVEVSAAEIIAAIAEGRVPRGRHRQVTPTRSRVLTGPARMRKPTLYLAAALAGATGIGLLTAGDRQAQAGSAITAAEASASQTTSVADALGLQSPDPAIVESDGLSQLQQMAASRAQREDAQAAAQQTQAAADQAAIAAAEEAARPRAVSPVNGARLTSVFGYRWGAMHAGVDLAAPMGTPEYAPMDGVVIKAGPASGFGLAVYIQHENGDVTVYGHMDQILVSEGQTVQAGDTIALVGNRGQSTGPHLHFEVRVGGIDGEKVDPISYMAERGVVIP